jgi:hypothetical protein
MAKSIELEFFIMAASLLTQPGPLAVDVVTDDEDEPSPGRGPIRSWRALNAHPQLVAAAAVLVSILYVWGGLDRGWIPHDEGQLGQSAERTLLGELPHRDFDDMYTGGLTLLGALAFRWFGVDCLSLRWMLGLWFAPTIAAFFYLASRVAAPVVAAAVTLLAAMLSLPVYSAPMPSWYNLFLAVLGAAALFRFIETNRSRWLVAAGLCGGISILFKITGLFFVAAAGLSLIYREQLSATSEANASGPPRRGWYSKLLALTLLSFAASGLAFLRSPWPLMNAIHFAWPLAAPAAWLFYHEICLPRGPSAARVRRMGAMAAPFGLGVGLPLVGLAAFFASRGALSELYEGALVLPRLRAENGAYPLPGLLALVQCVPLASIFACGLHEENRSRRCFEIAALFVLAAILAVSETRWGFFVSFHALRNITPLLVAIGLWMLLNSERTILSGDQKQHLFLMCSVAGLCSLVQFPHAYGIYFFYAAPLVLLAGVFIAACQPWPLRTALGGVLVFYLAFASFQLNGPDPHANVVWLGDERAFEPLELERCSLTVPADEAASYRELVATIQAHSPSASFILATPDCPEVYYLADRRNPSRVMYEFFRPEWLADCGALLTLLDEYDINVVVLHGCPHFSKRRDNALVRVIAERYSHVHSVMSVEFQGKAFERFRVYWRE